MSTQEIIDNQRRWALEHDLANDIAFRAEALDRLQKAIISHRQALTEALAADLGKSSTEAYMTEIGLALSSLRDMRHNLYRRARVRHTTTPLSSFMARSVVCREPYGVALIMVPWNYPVLLTLDPLIGAIAAGNTAVIRFSPYATHSAAAITTLITSTFPTEHVAIIPDSDTDFLSLRYDYIFFTGSPATGRIVMQAAAAHLTPVTLELGGKSPVIIHHTADINIAARRIVFGKLVNCGQTCVAPDYILVDEKIKKRLIAALKAEIIRQYTALPLDNPAYGHIINRQHFDRILSLIDPTKVVHGGASRPETLQIEPTIIDRAAPSDPIMQQEIFGPLLPVITYKTLDEAIHFVRSREKPLALYTFTENRSVALRITRSLSFGGGCVNDTIMHLASPHLPFGGVGQSGMGSYHGKYSYQTFSRDKSILINTTLLDLPLRYQPFTALKRRLIHWFLK